MLHATLTGLAGWLAGWGAHVDLLLSMSCHLFSRPELPLAHGFQLSSISICRRSFAFLLDATADAAIKAPTSIHRLSAFLLHLAKIDTFMQHLQSPARIEQLTKRFPARHQSLQFARTRYL